MNALAKKIGGAWEEIETNAIGEPAHLRDPDWAHDFLVFIRPHSGPAIPLPCAISGQEQRGRAVVAFEGKEGVVAITMNGLEHLLDIMKQMEAKSAAEHGQYDGFKAQGGKAVFVSVDGNGMVTSAEVVSLERKNPCGCEKRDCEKCFPDSVRMRQKVLSRPWQE